MSFISHFCKILELLRCHAYHTVSSNVWSLGIGVCHLVLIFFPLFKSSSHTTTSTTATTASTPESASLPPPNLPPIYPTSMQVSHSKCPPAELPYYKCLFGSPSKLNHYHVLFGYTGSKWSNKHKHTDLNKSDDTKWFSQIQNGDNAAGQC